jgi:hypothetical protein
MLKKILFNASAIIVFIACFSPLSIRCFGQDPVDSVQLLISVIKSGPMLYRTPEADEYFSQGVTLSGQAQNDGREAAIKTLRALVRLGDMGDQAKAAIPAIMEMFPQFEHVVVKKAVHFTKGNGTMEDWVQTFLVTEKNKFSFSSPFIEYASISKCENWMEAVPVTTMLEKHMGSGGRIVDAVADIVIILRVNAGACALARIMGSDAGLTREAWQNWLQKNQVALSTASLAPSQASPKSAQSAEMSVGGTYKIYLLTGDILSGVVTSMDDSSMSFKTDGGRPYTFKKVLIDKYEPIVISTPAVTQTSTAPTSQLTYEDLFSVSMIGKTLEVTTQNGSILKGNLVAAAPTVIRLSVDGLEVPVSRGAISKLLLISK